jgi:hypothetical protein
MERVKGMSEHDDELETMQGPSGLREHAKKLRTDLASAKDREQALLQELSTYKRRDAFEAARTELAQQNADLAEAARLEDVQDLPPEEVTSEALVVRATERFQKRHELLAEAAREMGFSSVDEFTASTQRAARERAQELQALSASGAIAAFGQAPPAAPDKPGPAGKKAFDAAKAEGVPDPEAQAAGVGAMIEAQTKPERRY